MNREALAWALSGALRFAVAAVILSLLLAALLSDEASERFATTGYLALIFAAIALAAKWMVRDGAGAAARPLAMPPLPAWLGYAVGMMLLLIVVAGHVSDPGAEARFIFFGLLLVFVAAIGRGGAFAALHSMLLYGGGFTAATRYMAAVAVVALFFCALLQAEGASEFAGVAYVAALVATVCVGLTLFSATESAKKIARAFERLGSELTIGRAIKRAVATLLVSFVIAAVVRKDAELFAILGYAAAIVAALGVALECKRTIRKSSATS